MRKLLLRRQPERFSRRWPRIAISEPAQIKMENGDDKRVIVNQLSVAGARIQTTVPLRAGDYLKLSLNNGTPVPPSVAARIIYSLRDNPGPYFACGLCFLGLAPHETQWLIAYIAAEQARRRRGAEELSESDRAES